MRIGLPEFARLAKIDNATADRLLGALSKHGLVEQETESRAYRLGAATLRLARIREELKAKHPLVGDVRGKGLMVALAIVSDSVKKSPAAKDSMQKIFDGAYGGNVLIRISVNTIILSPPLVVTASDIERIAAASDAAA
jgi:adenosylmethionine-8-amino-7-oxononanoate aminotransferase